MQALQTVIIAAKCSSSKRDWGMAWEAMKKMQQQWFYCGQWHAVIEHILVAIQTLADAWWNHSEWNGALRNIEILLHTELEAAEATFDVPIRDLRFIHSEANRMITNGDDAGMHVNEV